MNSEKIKAEFRELLPSHGPECTCLLCDWSEPIESFLLQKLEEEREEVLKSLGNYLGHDEDCIRNQWEAGEPTPDGGYRTLMRGKWYQTRPVDETPKCDCGFDEAINLIKKD